MDDVKVRSVAIENVPEKLSEDKVRSCLDNSIDGYSGKYDHVVKYDVYPNDTRWIVCFKNCQDASHCLRRRSWIWTVSGQSFEVTLERCSEGMIPQDWVNSMHHQHLDTDHFAEDLSFTSADLFSTQTLSMGSVDSFQLFGDGTEGQNRNRVQQPLPGDFTERVPPLETPEQKQKPKVPPKPANRESSIPLQPPDTSPNVHTELAGWREKSASQGESPHPVTPIHVQQLPSPVYLTAVRQNQSRTSQFIHQIPVDPNYEGKRLVPVLMYVPEKRLYEVPNSLPIPTIPVTQGHEVTHVMTDKQMSPIAAGGVPEQTHVKDLVTDNTSIDPHSAQNITTEQSNEPDHTYASIPEPENIDKEIKDGQLRNESTALENRSNRPPSSQTTKTRPEPPSLPPRPSVRRSIPKSLRPISIDRKRVLISGLGPDIDDDTIMNFLRMQDGVKPLAVERGERPESVIVELKDPPDISALETTCGDQACKGKFFQVSDVAVSNCIKVTGFRRNTSKDTLKLFFEDKLKDTKCEVEDIKFNSDGSACFVSFKDVKDAENACQAVKLKLDGHRLSVKIHHTFLDWNSTTVPDPFLVVADSYVLRFLATSSSHKCEIEKRLHEFHAKAEWIIDMTHMFWLRICCDVLPKDHLAAKKFEEWTKGCGSFVEWLQNSYLAKIEPVAYEKWEHAKETIAEIKREDSFAVKVTQMEETATVLIVGDRELVEKLTDSIHKEIEDKYERLMELHGYDVTKQYPLRLSEMRLIDKKKFVSKDVEIADGRIKIKGPRDLVNIDMKTVEKMLCSLVKKELCGFSKHEKELLACCQTRDYISKQILGKNLQLELEVINSDIIVATALTTGDLDECIRLMHEFVRQFSVHCEPGVIEIMKTDQYVQKKEEEHKGLLKIVLVDNNEIQITTVDYLHSQVREELSDYVDGNSNMSYFLEIVSGRFGYMMVFKTQDFVRTGKELYTQFEITDSPKKKGFQIEGRKIICREDIAKLRILSDAVSEVNLTVDWPGFDKFLTSEKGRDTLIKLELEKNCIIKLFSMEKDSNHPIKARKSVGDCRIGDCTIAYEVGEILGRRDDVIVVAVGESCEHSDGLGKDVVDKGGFQIQHELDTHVKGKSVSPAEVFTTSAGQLLFKTVIHIVLPVWNEDYTNERLLASAVFGCLREATEKKFTRIAFPAIGSGPLKYPMEVIAKSLVRSMKKFLKQNQTTSLRTITICENNYLSAVYFQEELAGGEGVYLPRGEIKSLRKSQKSDDVQIPIKIEHGSIEEQQVDVIVNSTNTNLNLKIGRTSQMLCTKAGGHTLQQECERLYPDGIGYGQVAVTSAGQLHCKKVFHGSLPRWLDQNVHAELVLKKFVANCLKKADEKELTTIAFPALGTGELKYPFDIVAKAMFDVVNTYQHINPDTKIQEVRIVIWKENSDVIQAFQTATEEQEANTNSDDSRLNKYMLTALDEFSVNDSRFSTDLKDITLCILEGDLVNQTTGVIVNSVLDLNLAKGNVSKAILQKAGQSIQTTCYSTANEKRMKDDELVVTKSGRLLCKDIIHLKAKDDSRGWKNSILKCLEEVENLGHMSVSFPTLGTGGKGFTPANMARTMYKAFSKYACSVQYQGKLRLIQIVVYEPEITKTFIRITTDLVKKATSGNTTVHIYASDAQSTTNVQTCIESLHIQEDIKLPTKIKLKDDQFTKICDMASRQGVTPIKHKNNKITLHGYNKNDVDTAKAGIEMFLAQLVQKV